MKNIKQFILHLHPKKVSRESIKFTRTFGLGGINALLFVILAFTGMLLRFSYNPTVNGAYDSVVYLQDNILFGQWLRNIHHFAAHLMVVTSFLHLLRVYYSHSIYKQRSKNWIYGLLLFLMVLLFNFTGYLLPWDQLSYWAVTVMTGLLGNVPLIGYYLANVLRGGEVVNGNTLLNFYTLHTGILPFLFVVFMLIHFWLVRKAGGVTTSEGREHKKVDSSQYLLPKEALMAVVVIAILLLFSALVNAPLEEQANPAVSPNPNKAPWYFLGVQELLLHFNPLFASFIVPLFGGAFFFMLPFFKYENVNSGVWFHSPRGKQMVFYTVIMAFVYTLGLIVFLEKISIGENWSKWWSEGLFPALLYVLPLAIFVFLGNKKLKMERIEMVQIGVTAIFTSYVVMMLVSLWLRGKGMTFIF